MRGETPTGPAGMARSCTRTGESVRPLALTQPQTTYLLNGEPIYVAVSLSEQTRGLKGIVKDAETKALLDNVAVATLGESVLTDANGYFELKIPVPKQQESYPLTLTKKGFKTATENYIPQKQAVEYRLTKN